MPEQKLTIVPVTLHSDTENISNIKPTVSSSNSTCTIKFGKVEISFFNAYSARKFFVFLIFLKEFSSFL
ncbi:hypothetical protein NST17_04450 [Caldifermentibacillus hisashii]|uniref:Uncharacterized protein n=1 Tax=Caldifermentibacillus hisashii TaxID=996558 RepID=A0ABU9JWR4_9BACI